MYLQNICIRNYKSLRQINFSPQPLSVIVGPNASGKSNFADAIHFLSEVYSHGLELAIARKGGYENIAFRRQRRTTAPLSFQATFDINGRELSSLFFDEIEGIEDVNLRVTHQFSLTTSGTGIKAAFRVVEESFECLISNSNSDAFDLFKRVFKVERHAKSNPLKIDVVKSHDNRHQELNKNLQRYFSQYEKRYKEPALFDEKIVQDQELFISGMVLRNPIFARFLNAASRVQVYQIAPSSTRTSGVPTPNPKLSATGENLPALVDWLQTNHKRAWDVAMAGMLDIIPRLIEIDVEYLHTKALGLRFTEEGVARPWSAHEVSDGTIQSLALLVASVDPRSSFLLIEEPENSVHPWIIRVLMERFRQVSAGKTVVLTSHSPVVLDLLRPEEVWVSSRKNGETELKNLVDIDPQISEQWSKGEYKISEFLDAGFVPQAVPGGVF